MGTVFLAEQLAVGNRQVALKVLHRKLLEDPDFLQRFRDEASSTGRIRHQNVVTVYECGQADDGSPYIAMEYLEGESLRQALKRRGSLPLLEAVEILQQAARGLNAAHKLGIVHRDLKPDNIFLTRDDEGKVLVKIVDFGIAKMRESTSHTVTGLAVGTPAYMSFEQASGMRSEELDGRSDIYSLGIVAYEMLTGRVPFQADTPLAYLRKHLVEPPEPIAVTRPDLHLSPEIDRAVMKALEKERKDRYPTAPEFARALADMASAREPALPETEYAIRDVVPVTPQDPKSGRVAMTPPPVMPTPPPVASPPLPISYSSVPVSPPAVRVPTVTLVPRKSLASRFALVGIVAVLAGAGVAAWYAFRPQSAPPSASPPDTAAKPNPVSGSAASRGNTEGAVSHSAAGNKRDLAHRANAATAQGDVFYQEGKYDSAIAEYKRALTLAPDNSALPTKIGHAASAKEAEQRAGMSPLSAAGAGQAKPHTMPELVDLLRNYAPPARVATFAQHGGINFELTDVSERELRHAGADDGLISVLRQLAPEPPAVDTTTHTTAVLDQAQDLIRAGQYKQALPIIQRSAASGNPDGQRFMGDAYELGWGVPKDYQTAREWYQKSAAGGNTLAMIRIGSMFQQGWGVPQDYSRARQWYEKSSAVGNPLAMVRIGDLYERGWGVPQDYVEGRMWYQKAAAKGNALAMLRLGNLYERGWGVPKDLKLAREWFEKSAEAGNLNARARLRALRE